VDEPEQGGNNLAHAIQGDRLMHTFQRCLALGLLMLAPTIAGTLHAASPDDVMTTQRLEKMLADGDTGMIMQTFKRYPGRTLPFIDQYLEGGLARIEKGEDPSKVLDQFRTGIRFAELADKAFGVWSFSEYANAFASWSPTEQKMFREGQKAYKNGLKEQDAAAARRSLERSLNLAMSLGDTWGQAMARVALTEAALKAGEYNDAAAMAVDAVEINARLQLKEDTAQAFRLAGRASLNTDQPVSAVSYLAQAWTIVERDPDVSPEVREATFEEYISVMEKLGMKDRADALRKARAKTAEAVAPAQTPSTSQ
jgi:hypothetical protein